MKCIKCNKSVFFNLNENFFVSDYNEYNGLKKPLIIPRGYFCANCGLVHWIVEDHKKIINEFELELKKKNETETETNKKITNLKNIVNLINKELDKFDKNLEQIRQDLKNENFTVKKINELKLLGQELEYKKSDYYRKNSHEREMSIREINRLESELKKLKADFEKLPISIMK